MSVDIIAATPRRERLSQWSRESNMGFKKPTNDWTKMNIRAMSTVPKQTETVATIKAYQMSAPGTPRSAYCTPRAPGAAYGDGRVDPIGNAVLSKVSKRDLHGAGPGNYSLPPLRTKSVRASLNTAYNQRAKDNYVYWYRERPKPTSFGRYGIGSYKTVLGLGNAPRT